MVESELQAEFASQGQVHVTGTVAIFQKEQETTCTLYWKLLHWRPENQREYWDPHWRKSYRNSVGQLRWNRAAASLMAECKLHPTNPPVDTDQCAECYQVLCLLALPLLAEAWLANFEENCGLFWWRSQDDFPSSLFLLIWFPPCLLWKWVNCWNEHK